MKISNTQNSKLVSNCSKIGAIAGLGIAVTKGLKNKEILKDTFIKATKNMNSKPLKTGLMAATGILSLAGVALSGSVAGEIVGELTEKVLNLSKKKLNLYNIKKH